MSAPERSVPGHLPVRPLKALRAPSMADVAKLAAVSHQTVSRVLNGHANVRPTTRLRVQAAMAELSYRPNQAARALVTGHSDTIGVVAPTTTLFGPASMLAAFELAASEAGFTVAVSSVRQLDRKSIGDAVERHLDQRVAGVVVLAPVASAGEALHELTRDVPMVSIDGDASMLVPTVRVDQQAGARLATEHLLAAGHPTVWHVAGPLDWFDSMGRVEGWRSSLEAAGAEVPPLLHAGWSAASGYEAGQMLARVAEATAVFTANDHLALGVLKALREAGRSVPEDVSVVGFDDIPESAYFAPPLTTVHQDVTAVALAALKVLTEQARTGVVGPHPEAIVPRLVQRESVRPPAGGSRRRR